MSDDRCKACISMHNIRLISSETGGADFRGSSLQESSPPLFRSSRQNKIFQSNNMIIQCEKALPHERFGCAVELLLSLFPSHRLAEGHTSVDACSIFE